MVKKRIFSPVGEKEVTRAIVEEFAKYSPPHNFV
jgi:hypothetical protein